MSRAVVTAFLGILGLVIVFLGAFVWDAVDAFVAFVTLFTVATTPWIVINTIGHFRRNGKYWHQDLQVITPGYKITLEAQGKRYEYHSDTNRRVVRCDKL